MVEIGCGGGPKGRSWVIRGDKKCGGGCKNYEDGILEESLQARAKRGGKDRGDIRIVIV